MSYLKLWIILLVATHFDFFAAKFRIWPPFFFEAAPRAVVGGWGPSFKSLVTGPSLLGNCFLENKFHK